MRFCHLAIPITNSRDGEKELARHKRIGAKSRVQCDLPHFMVSSARTIFFGQIFVGKIESPTRCLTNLTGFPFAHNFSKPDLEVL